MRSKFIKSLALALVVVAMAGMTALPGAAAQAGQGADDDYSNFPQPPVDCSDVPAPTVEVVGTQIVVTYPEIYLQCVTNITIVIDDVVLFDGPPSASLIIRANLPVLGDGPHTVVVTATTVNGIQKTVSLPISAADYAKINAILLAAGGKAANPIGGLAVAVPGLARTGSDINGPIALGATLVGAGGLVLLIARRREEELVA